MTTFSDRFDRQVIPRWHDSQDTILREESASLRPRAQPSVKADVEEIRDELTRTRAVGVAVDALNVALVAGDQALADFAASVIDGARGELPAPIVAMADQILGRVSDELPILPSFLTLHHERIHELRKLLKAYPLSPLLHLDIARHFVTLGLKDKAQRAVATALTLAPHNRVVLRATARFFFNAGDKDRAYFLIRDAVGVQSDPWLVAAEIAFSQEVDRQPRHWHAGKAFLERAALAPIHLSELATAVGTIELMSGNRKKARKLFAQGLQQPTENSLAQARWAELRTGMELVGEGGTAVPTRNHAFEADTLQFFNATEMASALESARQWFHFEPFSPMAASAIAHIGGLLDDYETVERYARFGLTAHPGDVSLRNNYLYAVISSGDTFKNAKTTEEAERIVRALVRELRGYVETGGYGGVHAMANLGLLAYRLGQAEDGRLLYERTIQAARRSNLSPQQAATAAIFHAREALLAGVPWANEAVETARTLGKPLSSSGQTMVPTVAFYLKKIEALARDLSQAEHILSAGSAAQFAPPKIPVTLRVTKNDDGGLVVWVPPSAMRSPPAGGDGEKKS